MKRKEFVEKSMLLGLGLPFMPGWLFQLCARATPISPNLAPQFSGKVIIVGAGAAGLTAGYLFKRYGVDFQIIEAAPAYGGRMKRADGFADFPIDLGAEWIHTDPSVLARIVGNPNRETNIEIIDYNPQTIKTWKNGRLKSHNYIRHFYSEWKFKNTTWYGFFEQYIIPDILDKIVLNQPINSIDHSAAKVVLKTANNQAYEADKVLITVPIKILQNGQIDFNPALPKAKTDAINQVFMGDGIKLFIEFKERFYPDMLAFGNIFRAFNEEEKFVYDAAFGKGSSKNILGLFAINKEAAAYTRLNTEKAIIDKFLGELDRVFGGKATPNYVNNILQNWSKEPYIRGAYSYSFDGNQKTIVATIQEPVNKKLYFAGEALSTENQAMVHGACESAYSVVTNMLEVR